MTKQAAANVVFKAEEIVNIVGIEQECDCSHCGRPLKLGVKLATFSGAFGADCLAKAFQKQTAYGYTYKLSTDGIKQRAIVAHKGAKYAKDRYGWDVDGPNFKVALKTQLQAI